MRKAGRRAERRGATVDPRLGAFNGVKKRLT
jgi:hypothetical protein